MNPKSISAIYQRATGQSLREQDIALVSKFANVLRAEIEKDIKASSASLAAPAVANAENSDALPPLPEPLEIDWPELHSQALGCGVEDRNIHDRYEAAEYGWQDGVDKAIERVPEAIYDADQMQAYARAATAAQTKPAVPLTGDQCHKILKAMALDADDWAEGLSYEPTEQEISKHCVEFILAHAAPNAQLVEIARLIGTIFYAGDFVAETQNERELEALLIKNGYRYRSWGEVEHAAALASLPPQKEALK